MRRRDFLKASAVGAGVSLLEACGGEAEEFLIQVANRPGALQGESIWRPTVCTQCDAGCGITVRVVDGNAKKIEGLAEHPVNRGGVCALGHSVLQEIYNPDRILTPLRRVGPEAPTPLGWEEALTELVDRIEDTSPLAMAFVGSDRNGFVGALLRRLAEALGAPAPYFVEVPAVAVERRAAAIALGVDDLPYFDVARSDYVLSIGAQPLDRWRSPVHYTRAVADMRRARPGRRGRLVQADARMSLTAANADEWIPLRPGSEGVFARAVAGVLLDGGGVGAGAAARDAALFSESTPSVEEAAEACDVPAEQIARVAGELASAERSVVLAGGSAAGQTNGLHATVAGLALNLLLDNLGREGGVYAPVRFGLASAVDASDPAETPFTSLAARLRGDSGPGVDLLFVAEADLVHSTPAGWGVGDAMQSVDSVVALSSFRDDTARLAHLVLPINTELERFNLVEPATSVGVRAVSVGQPVVDPVGEGHHPVDVLLATATALGDPVASRFPWSSFASLARERLEAESARLPGGAGVAASSFYFATVEAGGAYETGPPQGVPPGPRGPAPAPAPARFDGEAASFPYVLVPFPSLRMGEGRGANRPWLQEMPDPLSTVMWNGWVELSPADAEALGVRDGDRVSVASTTGTVEIHAVVDPSVRPGLVAMPLGHGHAEYGRYAAGRGANPMALVSGLPVDGVDAPATGATRVRVERLGPGALVRFGRGWEASLPTVAGAVSEEEGGP